MVNFKSDFSQTIVIFGASGFLGRYIVGLLVRQGYLIKVGVRNPDNARHLLVMGKLGQVNIFQCNILDSKNVENLVNNADIVINLVGILFEYKKQSFKNVHVDGATNIAKACNKYKVKSLIFLSALAVDKSTNSKYAKTKLAAENSIKKIFKNTTIIRPSVIYGPEDNFTNKFAKMAMVSPFIPLINNGRTKFQPVSVLDVAKAVVKIASNSKFSGEIYHLGGPEIFSFKEIIELILVIIEKKKIFINLTYNLAKMIACSTAFIPNSPITLDQIRLLNVDNIVPKKCKGFKDLNISPVSIQEASKKYLSRFKSNY